MIFHSLILLKAIIVFCTANEWPLDETKQIYENAIADFTLKISRDLHQSAFKNNENVIFSPINIYTILSLTRFVSSGDTAKEISSFLGLPNNEYENMFCIFSVYHYLTDILLEIQNSTVELMLSEGIFFQKDTQINETIAKEIDEYYKSIIATVDFSSNETTDYINKWVANQTKNRIPTLFSSPINTDTICILVCTLYFKADWQNQVKFTRTFEGKFNNGVEETDVLYMQGTNKVPYTNNPRLRCEAIALDYKGNEFSLFIILPYSVNDTVSLVYNLTKEDLNEMINSATNNVTFVDCKIPRVKIQGKNNLEALLKKSGVKNLFEKAEFSKLMKLLAPVKVSSISHITEIEINDKGTTGSSVSSLLIFLRAWEDSPPTKFYVDKPFIIFIYHRNTKTFLFNGIIYRPIEK